MSVLANMVCGLDQSLREGSAQISPRMICSHSTHWPHSIYVCMYTFLWVEAAAFGFFLPCVRPASAVDLTLCVMRSSIITPARVMQVISTQRMHRMSSTHHPAHACVEVFHVTERGIPCCRTRMHNDPGWVRHCTHHILALNPNTWYKPNQICTILPTPCDSGTTP